MKRLLTTIAVLAAVATPALAQSVGNPDAVVARRGPTLIDSQGWRYWNGNWDNTCFRTLNYLSSMSACTGGGGD
jgi:hypothetical protein